jgi:hypothetical protein
MTGRPDRVEAIDAEREMVVSKPYLPSEICAAAHKMIARG